MTRNEEILVVRAREELRIACWQTDVNGYSRYENFMGAHDRIDAMKVAAIWLDASEHCKANLKALALVAFHQALRKS